MKDARDLFEATFPMVTGMPRHKKYTPTLAIQCLMDCDGNKIDSDHPRYGKEQNVGLHGVIHPATMARVTTKETFDIDGFETTAKVDHAYCPFCGYSCSVHPATQQSCPDAFPEHPVLWVARLLLREYAIPEHAGL